MWTTNMKQWMSINRIILNINVKSTKLIVDLTKFACNFSRLKLDKILRELFHLILTKTRCVEINTAAFPNVLQLPTITLPSVLSQAVYTKKFVKYYLFFLYFCFAKLCIWTLKNKPYQRIPSLKFKIFSAFRTHLKNNCLDDRVFRDVLALLGFTWKCPSLLLVWILIYRLDTLVCYLKKQLVTSWAQFWM